MEDSKNLKIEALDSLRTSYKQVREKIMKAMDEITDKQVINSVSLSTASSIRLNISHIYRSTKELNGFFICPDELDPDKLTDYLIGKKSYIEDRATIYYFVCYAQKRRINSFYRDIKKGIFSCGFSTFRDKKELTRLKNEILERAAENVKIIRRVKK